MTKIALLPMKANSQRVPGKNFRLFAGKPLFAWILDTLLAIEDVSKVVIDTDAQDELAASGLQSSERLVVQQRPKDLCGDAVSMNLILAHDIATNPADTYLMTHTTNPFLSVGSIEAALENYEQGLRDGHDSLFTVDPVQMRFYKEDVTPVNHDPDNLIQTQDLEPWYAENSNLYIFSRDSFEATQARIGKNPIMMVTPKYESVDIDTADDWFFAEALAKARLMDEDV
jgi:CMP-N-acetylneuraminic acid synthetase